jgi:transposase
MAERFLNVRDAAKRLGIHENTATRTLSVTSNSGVT